VLVSSRVLGMSSESLPVNSSFLPMNTSNSGMYSTATENIMIKPFLPYHAAVTTRDISANRLGVRLLLVAL
jgi:hypothetical protein